MRMKCQREQTLTEIRVLHGLAGGEASLVVITQQFVQEVQSFGTDQMLVLAVDKPFPSFPGMSG